MNMLVPLAKQVIYRRTWDYPTFNATFTHYAYVQGPGEMKKGVENDGRPPGIDL